jgi:hypothetical protein
MDLPPWLNVSPRDFVSSASAGAAAGVSAGHLAESVVNDSARLALESQAQAARIQQAQEALAQHERIANMEMQARMEISRKAELLHNQQLAVQKAYKEGEIGVMQDRLQEAKTIAEAKSKAAAQQFSDEQGFLAARQRGLSVKDAMVLFPRVRPALVTSLRLSEPTEAGNATIVEHAETPGVHYLRQTTGRESIVTRPNADVPRWVGPVDMSDPEGKGRVTGRVNDPYIRERMGTNAPPLGMISGVPAVSGAPAVQFRYNPKTRKIEPITAQPVPSSQPAIDNPIPPDEESE